MMTMKIINNDDDVDDDAADDDVDDGDDADDDDYDDDDDDEWGLPLTAGTHQRCHETAWQPRKAASGPKTGGGAARNYVQAKSTRDGAPPTNAYPGVVPPSLGPSKPCYGKEIATGRQPSDRPA